MLFLKVDKKIAQHKIEELREKGLINKEYKIERDDQFVYIPINKKINGEIVEKKGILIKKIKSIKEIIGERIAYEIIGDIAILDRGTEEIAKQIINIHKNIKTVVRKKSAVEGIYRQRKVEHLAGEQKTETIHKENNIRLKLDIEKVYYSPRTAEERKEALSNIKNKNVMVFFAGIGPYALLACKNKNKVVAIELNPYAIEYLKENIRLNKCTEIIVEEGDVKEKYKAYRNWADVVFMPLPKSAELFLKEAIEVSKDRGIIYLYTFMEKEKIENFARNIAQENKIELKEIKEVKSYSPKINKYRIKYKVNK